MARTVLSGDQISSKKTLRCHRNFHGNLENYDQTHLWANMCPHIGDISELVAERVWLSGFVIVPKLAFLSVHFFLRGWVSWWVGGWVSGWVGEWMSGWVVEWVSGWVGEWVSGLVVEWVSGWVSEWVSEWEWKGTRERCHEGLISYIVMSCSRTGTQLVII